MCGSGFNILDPLGIVSMFGGGGGQQQQQAVAQSAPQITPDVNYPNQRMATNDTRRKAAMAGMSNATTGMGLLSTPNTTNRNLLG
ncbi:hypothetical protein [Caudoviricetes sp.]|nr:hypothetical protein [Caudoviricetes sp.]